jgi:Flp pilus assembly protein TadG
MSHHSPRRAVADQAGSISTSVPLLVLTVLVVVGFAFDGGNAITAHRRAVNLAEQAARAGAQRLDIAALRARGAYRLDHAAAHTAAAAYLASSGTTGQVQVGRDADGDYVQVTVAWSQPTVFAGLLGRSRFTGTGRARARNCHGLATEEGC